MYSALVRCGYIGSLRISHNSRQNTAWPQCDIRRFTLTFVTVFQVRLCIVPLSYAVIHQPMP